MILFFKKQKEDEMRIGDWSSDGCSSDLVSFRRREQHDFQRLHRRKRQTAGRPDHLAIGNVDVASAKHLDHFFLLVGMNNLDLNVWPRAQETLQYRRSEEHTSELQSLMRISSAVFCLKKKKNKNTKKTNRLNYGYNEYYNH